jgi:hypothetical protein
MASSSCPDSTDSYRRTDTFANLSEWLKGALKESLCAV